MDPKKILDQLQLKEGQVVADFGCGSGHLSLQSSKIVGKDGQIYAIDIQKPVLETLSSKIRIQGKRNIKVIWANLEIPQASGLPDKSTQLVIMSNILHLSKHHHNILREAYRVLTPGGQLLIIEWRESATPLGKSLITRVNGDTIRKEAENAGFSFAKEIKTDEYHHGWLYRK